MFTNKNFTRMSIKRFAVGLFILIAVCLNFYLLNKVINYSETPIVKQINK